MGRKLKKSDKQKKEEKLFKKEALNFVNENIEYFSTIWCVSKFTELVSFYLKIRNQSYKGEVKKINQEMIDFDHEYWIEIYMDFMDYMEKYYIKAEKEEDIKKIKYAKGGSQAYACYMLQLKIYEAKYKEAYNDIEKNKYRKSIQEALMFLMSTMSIIDILDITISKKGWRMRKGNKQTLKKIVTKFNKFLRPSIINIIEDGY